MTLMNDDRKEKVEVDEDMFDFADTKVQFTFEMDEYTFVKVMYEYDNLPARQRMEVLLELGRRVMREIKDMDY